MEYQALVGLIPEAKFEQIFHGLQRKTRISLEAAFGKRVKVRGNLFSLKPKLSVPVLQIRDGIAAEKEKPLAEELLRAYLYKYKPMLKQALDFVNIPNEEGITTEELDPLIKLAADKTDELAKALVAAGHDPENIALYFLYIKMEHALHAGPVRKVLEAWGHKELLPKLKEKKEAAAPAATPTPETPATPAAAPTAPEAEPKKKAPKKSKKAE